MGCDIAKNVARSARTRSEVPTDLPGVTTGAPRARWVACGSYCAATFGFCAATLGWGLVQGWSTIALLGVCGTALSVSLSALFAARRRKERAPSGKSGTDEAKADEADQTWAQHDSVLHDLSNAMTASLFMVRDLTRALDKGTELSLRRARCLSQELVSELSQISEHIVSSRQSVGLLPIVSAAVALFEPVQNCVEHVARLYPDVRCRVECDESASQATVSIVGGTATVKRIIENLVINACQGDREVHPKDAICRISADGNSVVLSVEDNGPGFSSVVLEAHPSARISTKAQGSGIGLYSCHQLVKRDRGTLNISNRSVGGARVTITWPRASAPVDVNDAPQESKLSISGTRTRPTVQEPAGSGRGMPRPTINETALSPKVHPKTGD